MPTAFPFAGERVGPPESPLKMQRFGPRSVCHAPEAQAPARATYAEAQPVQPLNPSVANQRQEVVVGRVRLADGELGDQLAAGFESGLPSATL